MRSAIPGCRSTARSPSPRCICRSTRRERHALARRIAAQIERKVAPLPVRAATGHERLRIGVLSPDLREHLNAYLLLPLLELIDRRHFEIFAYSLAADDGSAIRGKVSAAADRFRDLSGRNDRDAANLIRADEIDILVDCAGHTTGSRFEITAQRPAPVQALYLAFPSTLGSKRVDFAIVDRVAAPPGSEAHWSEALVYLPDTYFLYDFREPMPRLAAYQSRIRLAGRCRGVLRRTQAGEDHPGRVWSSGCAFWRRCRARCYG